MTGKDVVLLFGIFYVILTPVIYWFIRFRQVRLRIIFSLSALPVMFVLGALNFYLVENFFTKVADIRDKAPEERVALYKRRFSSPRATTDSDLANLASVAILPVIGLFFWHRTLKRRDF